MEVQYLKERRAALGGYLPQRRRKSSESFETPKLEVFDRLLKSSGEREISTTMAFVQTLNIALRDKQLGPRIVPIVADEARTFGMEGMFRQIGIYAPFGQKYKPVDADQLMYYREDQSGQVLQQGISEPGAISSWMAAGTSYSVSNVPMLPFYIYYSMFGFQRVGDIAWQAADMRTRGFLLGGTAGRTTLNGEGLQHEDGFSHLIAGSIPNCRSYDPTFGFEVTVILQHGMQKMMQEQVDEYYYLTLMNENYTHPDMPEGAAEGIIKGMYLLKDLSRWRERSKKPVRVRALPLCAAAGQRHHPARGDCGGGIAGQGFRRQRRHLVLPQLQRTAPRRFRRGALEPLNPEAKSPRKAYVTTLLEGRQGPVIAATDYVRAYADQIRAFMPQTYTVLGTDGFGRSDTRANLRRFFEVDRYYIAHAAIAALAADGKMTGKDVARAIKQYKIDVEKVNPVGIPIILLAEVGDAGSPRYEIIDGMQRLNAIMSFIEQEYSIEDSYFDLNTIAETKSKLDGGELVQLEPPLDRAACVDFAGYQVPVSIYSEREEQRIDEVFRRLNANGKHLSKQELRQAGATGAFANVVRRLSANIREIRLSAMFYR